MYQVWCTTQLAKLSFNHPNGRIHSWLFQLFIRLLHNMSWNVAQARPMSVSHVPRSLKSWVWTTHRSYSHLADVFTIKCTSSTSKYIFEQRWLYSPPATTAKPNRYIRAYQGIGMDVVYGRPRYLVYRKIDFEKSRKRNQIIRTYVVWTIPPMASIRIS